MHQKTDSDRFRPLPENVEFKMRNSEKSESPYLLVKRAIFRIQNSTFRIPYSLAYEDCVMGRRITHIPLKG
jgi:hypothetical protein